jgi:hypothetical protein
MSERARGIFSDIHWENGKVRVTLLHDPTVEGLDTAIYMDGSASMEDEYARDQQGGPPAAPVPPPRPRLSTKLWAWLHGRPQPVAEASAPESLPGNVVDPQIKRMLQYLASKDRNSTLRVAYWACGGHSPVEVVGELSALDLERQHFTGPQEFGGTFLLPALQDFVAYMREQQAKGSKRGCAVIVTDGDIFDRERVKAYSLKVAQEIVAGRLLPLNFVLVGVGSEVHEACMEEICHVNYAGIEHLWCHRIADEMDEIAQLVAVLVDETMEIGSSGRVLDHQGQVVKIYEGRIPAVLEFNLPQGCDRFVLEINGQTYEQALSEEDDHH